LETITSSAKVRKIDDESTRNEIFVIYLSRQVDLDAKIAHDDLDLGYEYSHDHICKRSYRKFD
jgi:hypothetical protein